MTWRKRVLDALLDPAIAMALFGAYLGLLLGTTKDLGYARDEGFYFQAAQSYEAWFDLLFREGARAALEPSNVDRYWSANHEHPALMKSLFALSHKYFYSKWHWFQEAGTAYRFPGMVVSASAVAITYAWGQRVCGRLAGLVSALLLAFMPRIFYQSHLAAFDMPVAAMWLVTTYAYWRSITTGGLFWTIATGVLYGLLLNTKHNSWLLPGALIAHFVLTRGRVLLHEIRRGRLDAPSALLAMATIGPLLFYVGWPWIWYNTGARLAEYVAFHTGHEYYNMEFLGRTYWRPPMPRLYAWVMTAATVPGITLLLSAVGLVSSAQIIWGQALPLHDRRERFQTAALWLLCILISYAPWFSPTTPIFGGTKHWITAYPFLCLFAGLGFQQVCSRLRGLVSERVRRFRIAEVGLFCAVVAAPFAMTLHSHPWGLSAYTPLVGGAPGAATLGLNRTFWGYTTGAVQDFLNRHVPRSGAVYVHDTALQSWEMMRADGRLRADLRGVGSIEGSDFAVYHHEPHMGKVEYQIWIDYGTLTPVHIGAYDGVPVIWVYARPKR